MSESNADLARAAIETFNTQMWIDNFDDYAVDVERVEESGERVAVLVAQRGKIKGSSVEVEQPLGFLVQMREGRALRIQAYLDWQETLDALNPSEPH